MSSGKTSALAKTDPDFVERFDNFAFDEVPNSCDLDDKTRFLAILAALMACQGLDEFRAMLKAILNIGLTPIQCKEIVYQGVPYLGISRVIPFLNALNEELVKRGISLPLASQQTTTMQNHYEKGMQAIVDIVGKDMKKYLQSGPAELSNINRWLTANCFGDYYTRTGLDYRQRELLTFCFLAGQGGCEPQYAVHEFGKIFYSKNEGVNNEKVISQLPYEGMVDDIVNDKLFFPQEKKIILLSILAYEWWNGRIF